MSKLNNRRKWVMLAVLPLIVVVCIWLWYIMSNASYTEVASSNGTWDLRNFDFEKESALLAGDVEYIPNALLTPEEFEARADEIQIGRPENAANYSTSRIRILLPDGVAYMLAGQSIDYSLRIYVNGKWMGDVGLPGASREEMEPDTASLALMEEPVDGVLTIVQQSSNFVHKDTGAHTGFRIGRPSVVRRSYGNDITALVMGCFMALFLVHLALFLIQKDYKANLYFSLFCLLWFFRMGVTGVKLFSTLLPTLSWYAQFRIEYISLPAAGILITLILNEISPGVLPKWFRYGVYCISSAFCGFYLFADTLLMSWVMLGCYVYLATAILFAVVRCIMKVRKPNAEQVVVMLGCALFLYSGIRDMFYYSGILLPPFVRADFSRICMLIFAFFQMTAMFMGTIRQAEEAKLRETVARAEMEDLRLKTQALEELYNIIPAEQAVIRGRLALDTVAQRAYIDGNDLQLAPKEFALLMRLAQAEGETVSKETIYEAVWKQPLAGNAGALWKQVSRLKQKLAVNGGGAALILSSQEGYRLEVQK